MPTLKSLTLADIEGLFTRSSLKKAHTFIDRVRAPFHIDQSLSAVVMDSQPQRVDIEVLPDGIHATCGCPYQWGDFCKHVGAVLLKWINTPDTFSADPKTAPRRDEHGLEVIPVEPAPTFRPEKLPAWMVHPFAARQRAKLEKLHWQLNQLTVGLLRDVAQRYGWPVRGIRKADITEQVAQHLANPHNLQATLGFLSAEERQVLRALILLGERSGFTQNDLIRIAEVWGKLQDRQDVDFILHDLIQTGLVLPAEESWHLYDSHLVPTILIRSLVPALDFVPTAHHPPPNTTAVHFADPYPFIRAVSQILFLLEESPSALRAPQPRPWAEQLHPELQQWAYVSQEIKQAIEEKQLGASDLILTVPPPPPLLSDAAIERLLPIVSDEIQLDFIYYLLLYAGVIQPGSPVTVWSEVKAEFCQQDDLGQRAILAYTYITTPNRSELWDLLNDGSLQRKRRADDRQLEPAHLAAFQCFFRRQVLRALACLPDDRWISIADLFRILRPLWPAFDESTWQPGTYRYGKPSWFLVSGKTGRPLRSESPQDWALAQGRFIRRMITGPLHWLGFADLAYDDQGELIATCFHGLGDLFWERIEVPPAPPHAVPWSEAETAQAAVADDAFTIRVSPSAISPQAHNLLNQIARLEQVTGETFVYRLDAHVTHRSFEAGLSLDELLTDWDHLLPMPLSEPIRDRLTAWWKSYGRVRIYEDLTVIEFSDEVALAEMKAVTPLVRHIVAEISPRLVIIPQASVQDLVQALEKAGYTPKLTEEV